MSINSSMSNGALWKIVPCSMAPNCPNFIGVTLRDGELWIKKGEGVFHPKPESNGHLRLAVLCKIHAELVIPLD